MVSNFSLNKYFDQNPYFQVIFILVNGSKQASNEITNVSKIDAYYEEK